MSRSDAAISVDRVPEAGSAATGTGSSGGALELRGELRAVDAATTLVTDRNGKSHRIPVPVADMVRLTDLWTGHQLDPALVDAAQGLRRQWLRTGLLAPIEDAMCAGDEEPSPQTAPPGNEEGESRGEAREGGPGDLLLVCHGPATMAPLAHALVDDGYVEHASVLAWDVRAAINRAYRTGELLVVLVEGPADGDLVDIDRWCHDMRVTWVPVQIDIDRAWVGPLITPGRGASFEDLLARRSASVYDRAAYRAGRTQAVVTGPRAPGLIAAALREAVTLEVGDRLVQVRFTNEGLAGSRGAGVSVEEHPVLPLPGSSTTHLPHTPRDLVDPVTGLILRVRSIRHHPSVPAALVTRQCDVADVRAYSRFANNILCQGSAFDDPVSAEQAAIGESVERYCGNLLDTLPVTHASWDELRRQGRTAIDPDELILYSDAQYAARGFPFVPLTRDTRVHWVPGRSLTHDREVLVPASLVYVNWYSAGHASAPPTNFCAFAGIAAGPDLDFAMASGLEEIAERHATMVWWLNAHPLPAVIPDEELGRLLDGTTADHQRWGLLHLDNDLGIPVAGAVSWDDTDELVNIGFSARPTLRAAARKAWTEALTLQEGSRDLLRMDGLHWEVMARGELNGRAFKPWRADRRYLDDFRPDFHDVDDLMVQQQVYLDPRAGRRMSHLLDPAPRRSLDDLPTLRDRSVSTYVSAFESAGYEVICVDITTPDVASTGFRVVRMLAPGTIGNAPAAFPFLGRHRVQDLAVQLGWRAEALAEADLNYMPLPHA